MLKLSKKTQQLLSEVKTVGTHSGGFHLDEVTAVALLRLFGGTFEVIRTRDKELFDKIDMLVDVGMVYKPSELRFDHHQMKDGSISSAGMIWTWLTKDLDIDMRKTSAFIAAVDAQDCGIKLMGPNSIAVLITNMNDSNQYSDKQLDNFNFAVSVIQKYLTGIIEQDILVAAAPGKIKAAKRVTTGSSAPALLFEEYCNGWQDFVYGKGLNGLDKIQRVIWFDKEQKNWKVQVPSAARGSFELNGEKLLPNEQAEFIHNNGFFGVYNSLEDAIALT